MVAALQLDASELRFLLREHSLILEPGEVLVVMVPPDWSPAIVRELNDALRAWAFDPDQGGGFSVIAVPGTAVAIGKQLAAVRNVKPSG